MQVTPQLRRTLGRELSRLSRAGVAEILAQNQPEVASGGWRVGFTGPPGVGKSTLVGRIAERRAAAGETLAVLAIDPSSPLTGGALLGDRIRMDAAAASERVFLRSLASRAAGDGLCDNLADMLLMLERHGFEQVMVETVGVGQAEHAVRALVDTVVLLVQPDTGDAVQALKAGTLEIADIVLVAKSDLPGASLAREQIAQTFELAAARSSWRVPVLGIAARDGSGLDALDEACAAHRAWLHAHADAAAVRAARLRYRVGDLMQRVLTGAVRPEAGADLAGTWNDALEALRQSSV